VLVVDEGRDLIAVSGIEVGRKIVGDVQREPEMGNFAAGASRFSESASGTA
jgi:hypothetical protein